MSWRVILGLRGRSTALAVSVAVAVMETVIVMAMVIMRIRRRQNGHQGRWHLHFEHMKTQLRDKAVMVCEGGG